METVPIRSAELPVLQADALKMMQESEEKNIIMAFLSGRVISKANSVDITLEMNAMHAKCIMSIGHYNTAADATVLQFLTTEVINDCISKFKSLTVEQYAIVLKNLAEGRYWKEGDLRTISIEIIRRSIKAFYSDDETKAAMQKFRDKIKELDQPKPKTPEEIEAMMNTAASNAWHHYKKTDEVTDAAVHCYKWLLKKLGIRLTDECRNEIKQRVKDRLQEEIKNDKEKLIIKPSVARLTVLAIQNGTDKKYLFECKREGLRTIFSDYKSAGVELFK